MSLKYVLRHPFLAICLDLFIKIKFQAIFQLANLLHVIDTIHPVNSPKASRRFDVERLEKVMSPL